jgi:hypothetical protein
MLTLQAKIAGCGKGAQGWFDLREANVSYDHPFHFHLEHSLNIDFVNEAAGPSARVAVELTPEAARELAMTILATLEKADADGYLEATPEHVHSNSAGARLKQTVGVSPKTTLPRRRGRG